MNNAPQVKIQYLVNYDLEISGQNASSGLVSSDLNPLSDLADINSQDAPLKGKKGLILSGGSVDEKTGEVSGCLLDGTYTFFKASERAYNGIMGNSLSRSKKTHDKDTGYSFMESSDYESKTGTELEAILKKTLGYDVLNEVAVDENTYGEYLELNGSNFLTKYLPSDYNPNKKYYLPIEYKHYCTEDSEHFKSGNVYLIKWVGYDRETPYYGMGYELIESPQFITIKAKNENTYIRSLLIYFDPVAIDTRDNFTTSEYATQISFSNAKKMDYVPVNVTSTTTGVYYIKDGNIYESVTLPDEYDATQTYYLWQETNDSTITSAKKHKNNRMVFLHNFGENSTLTQVQVNIEQWSKKNSLMKILKIVTGYTGIYDKSNLMKFDFSINKTNDPQQLRFGVSSNDCSIDVLDNDLMIDTLYQKDLIYKNIQVQILVDGVMQGVFYINEKSSEKGSNEWIFDCVDRLETLKEIKRPMMAIARRNIYEITNYVLSGVVSNVVWEKVAMEDCQNTYIEKSYFEADQTLYDLLLKCCQVGLLRIYVDRNDTCKITSGV